MTTPVTVTNGRSVAAIELTRRTATGSSASARAIASIVPSMIHDALAIGARIGPESGRTILTAVLSKSLWIQSEWL